MKSYYFYGHSFQTNVNIRGVYKQLTSLIMCFKQHVVCIYVFSHQELLLEHCAFEIIILLLYISHLQWWYLRTLLLYARIVVCKTAIAKIDFCKWLIDLILLMMLFVIPQCFAVFVSFWTWWFIGFVQNYVWRSGGIWIVVVHTFAVKGFCERFLLCTYVSADSAFLFSLKHCFNCMAFLDVSNVCLVCVVASLSLSAIFSPRSKCMVCLALTLYEFHPLWACVPGRFVHCEAFIDWMTWWIDRIVFLVYFNNNDW